MGRIARTKKPPGDSPAAGLIDLLTTTPDEQLASVLHEHSGHWPYPRTDLQLWIDVLNRFDGLLERTISDYHLPDVQMNVFTPRTKTLILGILAFMRLLLDHATNKKIFQSYDVRANPG